MSTGATALGPFTQRYEEDGDGRPMLLLHGIYAGANAHEWDALMPRLVPFARVRVPDLLGCGASDRPDLEYSTGIVLAAVDALIRDAGSDVHVVASSLTGAYATRAVARGAPVRRLTLITPTGLGRAQTGAPTRRGRVAYAIGRHTPVGDLLTRALGSRPSVRWFLRRQAFADPQKVSDAMVEADHRGTRLSNAKHLILAFVCGQLALRLDASEIRATRPQVLWAAQEQFSSRDDAERWTDAGATVEVLDDVGLPQAEDPERVATLLFQFGGGVS